MIERNSILNRSIFFILLILEIIHPSRGSFHKLLNDFFLEFDRIQNLSWNHKFLILNLMSILKRYVIHESSFETSTPTNPLSNNWIPKTQMCTRRKVLLQINSPTIFFFFNSPRLSWSRECNWFFSSLYLISIIIPFFAETPHWSFD